MTRCLTVVFLICTFAFCSETSPHALGKEDGKGKRKKTTENPFVVANDDSRVSLAFDPGCHTRPISAMSFNQDQTKLITVGWDYTIQIWNTRTGERLDIIRLPAYGSDNGFDSNRWNHAAISTDGTMVAIGGGPKLLYQDNGIPTRLLIVDVVNRRVRKMIFPADAKSPVTCLGFSANGDRLAVGFGGDDNSVYIQSDIVQLMKNAPGAKLPSEPALVVKGLKERPHFLALSRTGKKLVVEQQTRAIMSFDVSGNVAEKWKQIGEFKKPGRNDLLEWAPDESHFVFSWSNGTAKHDHGIQFRTPDGVLQKEWTFGELTPGFGRPTVGGTFRYLDAKRLYITAKCTIDYHDDGCVGVILDPNTGSTVRLFEEDSTGPYNVVGTASTIGKLGAIATKKGMEATIFNLADGKIVASCGSRTPLPTIVGWSKAAKFPVVAWSDDVISKSRESTAENLRYAFDLAKMEPVAKLETTEFLLRQHEHADFKLIWNGTRGNKARLMRGEEEISVWGNTNTLSMVPNGTDRPLIARAAHDNDSRMGSYAFLYDYTGKVLVELLPVATQHQDVVPSPDGRYALFSTGTHRLSIYRTDGSQFPLLNLVQVNGEWICWSPEGYFAASPGGERFIGWSESKGPNEFPVFHSVEKFAKEFRRPDILKSALEKGSVREALNELKTEIRAIADILPARCELELIKQSAGHIQVRATANAGAEGKPVVAMRLLLDGRPLAGGKGQTSVAAGAKAEATWELEIPAGSHELKLLARDENSSVVSNPLIVKGPKSAGSQPVLYRLCVGVDQYALSALNLQSAVKDATDVHSALEQYCVGTENRFGTSRGALLTNQQATRQNVLTAITQIRKLAKPGDLVVFLFAGHGVKQQEEFYLMTHEADPSQSLQGKSLSGADLRQSLSEIECPVLLVLDACHSASSIKAFRPATDELTRSLTDVSAGVTVLAAAMSHEVASATNENGYFTSAFLKALKLEGGIPYDPYENVLYMHHVYSVIFSEVRKATNGKQNPFLSMPWTVPPLAIRDVPR
jgi:WD40 repeat protein